MLSLSLIFTDHPSLSEQSKSYRLVKYSELIYVYKPSRTFTRYILNRIQLDNSKSGLKIVVCNSNNRRTEYEACKIYSGVYKLLSFAFVLVYIPWFLDRFDALKFCSLIFFGLTVISENIKRKKEEKR